MNAQFDLLKSRRFFPLFITQFLGAFNDNVFKNALIILITYSTADSLGLDPRILVTAAAGIFILPFFLYSALAGQIADSFDKALLIKRFKMIELALMVLACLGFLSGNIYFLLGVLFLMGTQSSFFGPLKYGILPDHLKKTELIGANALVEASTFIAILVGTIIGGYYVLKFGGSTIIGAFVITVACIGLIASHFIPKALPRRKTTKINWNIWRASADIIQQTRKNKDLFTAILGISWFWLVGFVFLTQLPVLGKTVLGANENVVTLFLTCFSIGVGAGSLFCNRLLNGEIRMVFAPFGAIGMCLFTVIMCAVTSEIAVIPDQFIGLTEFLNGAYLHWVMLGSMGLIAVSGGVYVVPLYAVLQERSQAGHKSRTIAANNIMNAFFMVMASFATLGLLKIVPDVTDVFLILAVCNLVVAFLFWRRVR